MITLIFEGKPHLLGRPFGNLKAHQKCCSSCGWPLRTAYYLQKIFKKQGVSLPNICYLCYNAEEATDHILLHCPFVVQVCSMLLFEVDLKWVFPSSTIKLYEQWQWCYFGKGGKGWRIWKMWISAIRLSQWLKRNKRIFVNHSNLRTQCRRSQDRCLWWVSIFKVFANVPFMELKLGWVNIVKNCELPQFSLWGFCFGLRMPYTLL